MLPIHEYHFRQVIRISSIWFGGIVKFDVVFPRSRYNELLNSLYATLRTLEICFILS